MRRLISGSVTLLFTLLLVAPAAVAANGEGTYGETDDKIVTYAGFIVMTFFVVFVSVMSLIQWKLERRKQERWLAKKARAARDRGGW